MIKTILLTGVSGYVGLYCAKELLELGHTVRGTVRNQAKAQEVRETLNSVSVDTRNLTFVELDLTADQGWNLAAEGCDFVMQAHKIPEGMIWKRIRLAFLSPKILKAIVDGTTNRELSIKMLTQHDLPRDWSEQEALFLS
ncbi:NAD-dependent epimerase/dehydratase family protein [Planktomarina sp.]|nr:NAD-dependent epimerase/dehydratase family protein [Planktomarina sp.]